MGLVLAEKRKERTEESVYEDAKRLRLDDLALWATALRDTGLSSDGLQYLNLPAGLMGMDNIL